jgi:hypothetical protein
MASLFCPILSRITCKRAGLGSLGSFWIRLQSSATWTPDLQDIHALLNDKFYYLVFARFPKHLSSRHFFFSFRVLCISRVRSCLAGVRTYNSIQSLFYTTKLTKKKKQKPALYRFHMNQISNTLRINVYPLFLFSYVYVSSMPNVVAIAVHFPPVCSH